MKSMAMNQPKRCSTNDITNVRSQTQMSAAKVRPTAICSLGRISPTLNRKFWARGSPCAYKMKMYANNPASMANGTSAMTFDSFMVSLPNRSDMVVVL